MSPADQVLDLVHSTRTHWWGQFSGKAEHHRHHRRPLDKRSEGLRHPRRLHNKAKLVAVRYSGVMQRTPRKNVYFR